MSTRVYTKKIKDYLKSLGMESNETPGGYLIYRYPGKYRLIVTFKKVKPNIIRLYNETLKYKGPFPTLVELQAMVEKYGLKLESNELQ